MIIYKITNKINGKIYIGQTISKKPSKRWGNHRSSLRKGIHSNKHLQSAWLKYKEEGFTFEIIEESIPSIEILNDRERYWIQFYNSTNQEFGYNLETGGSTGQVCSLETREKLSKLHQGKIFSKETRDKLSKAHAGKIVSIETRNKLSKANSGKSKPLFTEEHRKNISNSAKNRKNKKISNV